MEVTKNMKSIFFMLVSLVLYGCATRENGFEYVDLALPSGNLWAACNVGAQSVLDGGEYFAWGETQPSAWDGFVVGDEYSVDWSSYKYFTPDSGQSKYNFDTQSKYYDGLFVLDSCDDAATVNMGGKWVTPSLQDYIELSTECQVSFATNYKASGISGELFVSKHNGKSIFFPEGCLWTSELERDLYVFYGLDGKKVIEKRFDAALTSCGIGLYRCQTLHVRGIIAGKNRDELVLDSLDQRMIEMINEGDTSICDRNHAVSCIP